MPVHSAGVEIRQHHSTAVDSGVKERLLEKHVLRSAGAIVGVFSLFMLAHEDLT